MGVTNQPAQPIQCNLVGRISCSDWVITRRVMISYFSFPTFVYENTGWPIKIHPNSFNLTCSHDRNTSNFKTAFICYYTELSFEVYNFFLGQLAQKWQVIKIQHTKKKMFYCDLLSKIDVFQLLFSHFKIWQPAIFEPVDLREGCINF